MELKALLLIVSLAKMLKPINSIRIVILILINARKLSVVVTEKHWRTND